ncbi:MAG: hypothetical protein ABIQ44_14855, partial [Chloroflexia bacterium]
SGDRLRTIVEEWKLIKGVDRKTRAASLRSGKISVAEGPATLWMKEMKGARLYGMMAHYISVGGVQFQLLDAKQYGAFEQSSKYRIFYIKNPPTQTILSAESLG